MTKTISTALWLPTTLCFVLATNCFADNSGQDDYTGLPVAKADIGSAAARIHPAELATFEPVEKQQTCEVVEGKFDYTDLPQVRCIEPTQQEVAEWSYLY